MDRHPVFKLEDLKSCIPCPKIYLNFFKLNPVSNSFFPSGMKNHFIISQNFFGIRNESNAKKGNDENIEQSASKKSELENNINDSIKRRNNIKKCLTTLRVKYKTVTIIYFNK